MAILYSDVLLDHFRNPRNEGSLPAADIIAEDVNPLCGDRIRLEVKLNGKVIEAARFRGDGCAISIAAASLLTEMIVGRTLDQEEVIADERLLAALESDIKPARIKCALLALDVLRLGIKKHLAGASQCTE